MIHQTEYIDKHNYPFILSFTFPNLYNGSKLCFLNDCEIVTDNKNYEIIGKGEKNQIYLKQNSKIIIIKVILCIIFLLSFISFIRLFYHFEIKDKFELSYPISLITILTIISLTNIENINFLKSYFYQYPGGDGHL